jgi:hypothetical protein
MQAPLHLANHALAVWIKKHGKWNAVALRYYRHLRLIESKGPNPLRAIELAKEHMAISNKINTVNGWRMSIFHGI